MLWCKTDDGNYGILEAATMYLLRCATASSYHALAGTLFISNQTGIVEKKKRRALHPLLCPDTRGIHSCNPTSGESASSVSSVPSHKLLTVGVQESRVEFHTLTPMHSQPESYPKFVQTDRRSHKDEHRRASSCQPCRNVFENKKRLCYTYRRISKSCIEFNAFVKR